MIDFQEFGEAAQQHLRLPGPMAALAAQALLVYVMRRQDGSIRGEVLRRLARDQGVTDQGDADQGAAGQDDAAPDMDWAAADADIGSPARYSTGSATSVLTLLNTCGVEALTAPKFIRGFVRHLQDRLPAILVEDVLKVVPELELVASLGDQSPLRHGDGGAEIV